MNRIVVWFVAALVAGCGEVGVGACGDAGSWSERVADWPVDTVWIGEAPLDVAEAQERLELPARDGREALVRALIVAELNLADGTREAGLAAVYEGHAWLSTDDGNPRADEEAAALALRIDQETDCT